MIWMVAEQYDLFWMNTVMLTKSWYQDSIIRSQINEVKQLLQE